jgi:thiol-disulfide isomerase/thioredoxin
MIEMSGTERPGRRWLYYLLEAAVFVVAFVGLQFWLTRDVASGPLPLLEGVLVDGTRTTSAQWRAAQGGRPFVVYVWATWCPICKTVEGSVDAVAREAPVLTIAMQSGGTNEVGRFLAQRGYRWTTLIDPDAQLSRTLGVGAVPTLLFVDRQGVIRATTQGYTSELGIRLRLWWARSRG